MSRPLLDSLSEDAERKGADQPTASREGGGPKRVVLWSASRARSTAFFRAVSMRADTVAMHELLTEPYLREHSPDNYSKLLRGQQAHRVESSGVSYHAMLEVMTADYSLQVHQLLPATYYLLLTTYYLLLTTYYLLLTTYYLPLTT